MPRHRPVMGLARGDDPRPPHGDRWLGERRWELSADDGGRTRRLLAGDQAFYRMNYVRAVPPDRVERPTFQWIPGCSYTELRGQKERMMGLEPTTFTLGR